MQLDLPFLRSTGPTAQVDQEPVSPKRAPYQAREGGREGGLDIDFVRVSRARRYILRVRPDGRLRVTIPRGGSRAGAQRFVETEVEWIQRERARLQSEHGARAWGDGTTTSLRGGAVVIRVTQDGPARYAMYGDRRVALACDAFDIRPFIERDLRALAQAALVPRVHELAARHSLTVARVTIRNQRSRWGSCSRSGRIALNFRLIQMPPHVSDYVILHELMHLTEQNHSIRFWRLVERACPGFRDAERWLKTEGRTLL